MKPTLFFTNLLLFFTMLFSITANAQSVVANSSLVLKPVGAATRTLTVTRSDGDFGGSGNYTWSISPAVGVSLANTTLGTGSGNATNTVTFTSAAVGPFTITVRRSNNSGATATTTVSILNDPATDFWAAYNGPGDNNRVDAFRISGGTYTSGPALLFEVSEGDFAALGRSPYPTVPEGFFYWMPNTADNDGAFRMYGKNGDGSGATATVISNFDINQGSNIDLGFVRLALDKDGVGWVVASDYTPSASTKVTLTKITFNGLNLATAEVVDDDITLVGGTAENFRNGDVCLDGNGNLYILVNNNGNTEIFMGKANGMSTVFTKRWNILNNAGLAFGGSVNGNSFDQYGGMYLSSNNNDPATGVLDGVYYLDPATISNSPVGSTIQAVNVFASSGYSDLGTNVWPLITYLPVTFGAVQSAYKNGSIEVNWQTETENGNKYFGVEASADGQTFHEIAKVNSKAVDGNSATSLNYSFSVDANKLSGLMGGIFMLIFGLLTSFSKRRAYRWIGVCAVVLVTIFTASCNKNDADVVDVGASEKVYIRIAQYDNNDKVSGYSKVVIVVKN